MKIRVRILISSLSLYLTAISKLDLSYVLPIHASSYVLNGIFAWAILGEDVTGMRWVSTFIISCGALCVGLSDSSTADSVQHNNLKSRNLPLFFLPFSLTISKTWLAIMISSVSDASGDLLLAVGMKKIGEIERVTLPEVKKMIKKIKTDDNFEKRCSKSIIVSEIHKLLFLISTSFFII